MNIRDITCGTVLCHKGETYVTIEHITTIKVNAVNFIAISASKKLMLVTFTINNDGEITGTNYDVLTDNIMSVYSKLMTFASNMIILTKN